jgi:hypothetical protein
MDFHVSRVLVWWGYQFSLTTHELSSHGSSLSTVAYHSTAVHRPNQKEEETLKDFGRVFAFYQILVFLHQVKIPLNVPLI